MNKTKFPIYLAIISLALFGMAGVAGATTYYVSPDGNDANSGLVYDLPKQFITTALQIMISGDTLILKDGVYIGANNMIGDNSSPKVFPPAGTSGNYTVIKAEHEGQAIIDGEYLRAPFSSINTTSFRTNYLRLEGIHFRRGACGVFALKGDYNKVIKSGFEDGQAPTNENQCPIALIGGGSSHTLVEDSWAWGKGRYALYTSSPDGGTHHIIFRRVVARQDSTPLSGPASAISFYNAHDNVAQNVIVIDSSLNASTTNIYGAFGTGGAGTNDAERNHSYRGVIALNNMYYSGFAPYKLASTTTISDSIFWDNGKHGIGVGHADAGNLNISHVTSGFNSASGFRSNLGYDIIFNVLDSISINNAQYGFTYINSVDHVNTFGNSLSACSNCSILNGITTNPLMIASGYNNPGIKYLPRIESDSNIKGVASDGGDIGANILYQIGVSETLYGENGWDGVTTVPLWPLVNESIWATKMKSYTVSGTGGNRGFAALAGSTATPLTDYIWSYLGNPKPDIYGGSSDPTPPAAPTGLAVR